MIIVRMPLRVSFFGKGTDHPAWFNAFGPGAVPSTSVDTYVRRQDVLAAVQDVAMPHGCPAAYVPVQGEEVGSTTVLSWPDFNAPPGRIDPYLLPDHFKTATWAYAGV